MVINMLVNKANLYMPSFNMLVNSQAVFACCVYCYLCVCVCARSLTEPLATCFFWLGYLLFRYVLASLTVVAGVGGDTYTCLSMVFNR